MIDLVAAEWLKLRTTRLLHWTVPTAVALSLAAVAGAVLSGDGGRTLETTDGIRNTFSVSGTGALVLLVAGIIVAAGEHRHGTAGDTYLTTPRRAKVIAAKLALAALIGAAVSVLDAAASVALAAALYAREGASFPFDDAEVWLSLAGAATYTTSFAVIGVGLGALLRNQVTAIAIALAWIAVVEHTLIALLPDLGRWLPAAAGQATVRPPHVEGLLSPWAGATLLTGYTIAFALAGTSAAVTRDV